MSSARRVGVIGATSPVGRQVLALLVQRNIDVVALSRSEQEASDDGVRWVNVGKSGLRSSLASEVGEIHDWIVVAHIWVTVEYEELFKNCGAKRLVCISSTSRFTKTDSSSEYEDTLVHRLEQAEVGVQGWSKANGVAWTILRPTLIYGRSTDRNLSEIVRLIRKWRFFPLFGGGHGKRQPIYVDDVAQACVLALDSQAAYNKAYNISGAEVLSYRDMVGRVFHALEMPVRYLSVPLPLFNLALFFLRLVPRYKNWNADMVMRMNRDMIFDHSNATGDFGFQPRPFQLTDIDVR